MRIVSWELHRIVGEAICGFSSKDIDRLIDAFPGHDASRYDANALVELYRKIKGRYGDKGVCYMVLHHFLDRLKDIIVSLVSKFETFENVQNVCTSFADTAFERLVRDDKNILTCMYSVECFNVCFSDTVPRRVFEELWSWIDHVLQELRSKWRKVLFAILIDKDFESTFRRAMYAAAMRGLSKAYRIVWGTYRGSLAEAQRDIEVYIHKALELYRKLIECYKP